MKNRVQWILLALGFLLIFAGILDQMVYAGDKMRYFLPLGILASIYSQIVYLIRSRGKRGLIALLAAGLAIAGAFFIFLSI